MGWVNSPQIQALDRWVMARRWKKKGNDETSVKDGVIVRIDQAVHHHYQPFY